MKKLFLGLIPIFFAITIFAQSKEKQVVDVVKNSKGQSVRLYSNNTWNIELPKISEFTNSGIQGNKIIKKNGFTVSYSEANKIPSYTAYWLTADNVHNATIERESKFRPESGYITATDKDYRGSGYDKGHLVPAKDMAYSSSSEFDCFSYINIAPQVAVFNRGEWKKLEELVRNWALENDSLYVITGTYSSGGLNTIGKNVIVPTYFYKAVLDYKDPDAKAIAFIIPNAESLENYTAYTYTIDELEKRTGIDFFSNIPEPFQSQIESSVDLKKWNAPTSTSYSSTTSRNTYITTSTDNVNKSENAKGENVQCKGITKSGTQCKRMTTNASGYCWQHQSQASGQNRSESEDDIYYNSNSSSSSSSSTTSSSSSTSSNSGSYEIQTGPRGGKYYINSSGKKVYVKRK